jgi:hypothetical protein
MSSLHDLDREAAMRILAELHAQGITTLELARELQVSKASLRRWATGACEPRYSEGLWLRSKLELMLAMQTRSVICGEVHAVMPQK